MIDVGAASVLLRDHIEESGPLDRLAKTPFEKPFWLVLLKRRKQLSS